jgi:hypothetical protein
MHVRSVRLSALVNCAKWLSAFLFAVHARFALAATRVCRCFLSAHAPMLIFQRFILTPVSRTRGRLLDEARMPEDLLGLYEQMGEGSGMFHRVELITAVIGDGDLPEGLEAGLCARPLGKGREVKIDVSPSMALRPEPAQGWMHAPRENPFPVSYLVKVLSVETRQDLPARQRLDSALVRRRRANVCYARALSLLPRSSVATPLQRGGSAPEGTNIAMDETVDSACLLFQEACHLYEQALEMARLPPQAVLLASDQVARLCHLPLLSKNAVIRKCLQVLASHVSGHLIMCKGGCWRVEKACGNVSVLLHLSTCEWCSDA